MNILMPDRISGGTYHCPQIKPDTLLPRQRGGGREVKLDLARLLSIM